jgi:hypothetical protein
MQQRVESLSKRVGCSGIKDRIRLKREWTLRLRPMGIARYYAPEKSFVVNVLGARTVNRHRWER